MWYKKLFRLLVLCLLGGIGLLAPTVITAQDSLNDKGGGGIRPALTLIIPTPEADVNFEVNTTTDTVDATPGDGLCADAGGLCSIRAAIMETNMLEGYEGISIPAGTYNLTLIASEDDAAAVGDLDIPTGGLVSISGKNGEVILNGGNTVRIFDIKSSTLVYLNDLTLTQGSTTGAGGAMLINGRAILNRLTITGNHAGTDGGGIYGNGFTVIYDSTFSANTADGDGGALWYTDGDETLPNDFWYGDLHLYNVTVSGNSASEGGGLYIIGSLNTYVQNLTVAYNTASTVAGGVFIDSAVNMANALVAFNNAPVSPECNELQGTGLLLRNNTGCDISSGDTNQTGTGASPLDPLIGPLADNGGTVQTHALLLNSPARDKGDDSKCELADARGVARPLDGDYNGLKQCDVGAFEYAQPFTLFTPAPGSALKSLAIRFGWIGDVSAVKYLVQARGVGNPFTYKLKRNANFFCEGTVCIYRPELVQIPNNARFEWRVTAIDGGGQKTVSLWYPFSTSIPSKVTLFHPGNDTVISDTGPSLVWHRDSRGPNPATYTLIVTDAQTKQVVKKFTSLVCDDIFTNACGVALDIAGVTLTPGKRYQWQVIGVVPGSWTVNGVTVHKKYKTKTDVWTFTVTDSPTLSNTDGRLLPIPQLSGQ